MIPHDARFRRLLLLSVSVLLLTSVAGAEEKWKSLFDGKSLGKWKITDNFDFENHGKIEVKDGTIAIGPGKPGSAVRYSGKFPKIDYEVSLEAMRVEGEDFFCGMSFPVGESACSLIVGGWRGPIVGLSLIDDEPAVENETCVWKKFESKRWYAIRLRVTRSKIEAWIDKEKVVDFPTKDRKLSIYFEEESVLPLSVATWRTGAAVRNIRLRKVQIAAD